MTHCSSTRRVAQMPPMAFPRIVDPESFVHFETLLYPALSNGASPMQLSVLSQFSIALVRGG